LLAVSCLTHVTTYAVYWCHRNCQKMLDRITTNTISCLYVSLVDNFVLHKWWLRGLTSQL